MGKMCIDISLAWGKSRVAVRQDVLEAGTLGAPRETVRQDKLEAGSWYIQGHRVCIINAPRAFYLNTSLTCHPIALLLANNQCLSSQQRYIT